MALNTQQVNIQFQGGIDQKTNEQLVIPSKLLRAENVEFESNTVQRRRALTELSPAAGSGSLRELGAPVRGFVHGNSVLVEDEDGRVGAPGRLYPFGTDDVGSDDFQQIRNFMRLGARVVPQVTLDNTITTYPLWKGSFDCCTDASKTYICTAWEETDNDNAIYEIAYRVTDSSGKVYFNGRTSIGQPCCKPRVLWNPVREAFAVFFTTFAAGSRDYSVYVTEVGVAGLSVAPALVLTLVGDALVEDPAGYPIRYDACAVTDNANPSSPRISFGLAAAESSATGLIQIRTLKYDYTVVSVDNTNPSAPPSALTTYAAADYSFDIFYGNSDNEVRGTSFFGISKVQSDLLLASPGTAIIRIAATNFGSYVALAYDAFPATTTAQLFYTTGFLYAAANLTGGAISSLVVESGHQITGQFGEIRGRKVLPMTWNSTQFQTVTMLLDASAVFEAFATVGSGSSLPATWVARLSPGNIFSEERNYLMLPQLPSLLGDEELLVPVKEYVNNAQLAGGVNVTRATVSFAFLDGHSQLADVGVNGLRFLSGALPLYFDGEQFFEESFHWGPEIAGSPGSDGLVSVSPYPTGTGEFTFPAIGTYIIAFTMVWQDAANNWHESPVAAHGTVTTTSGNLDINAVIHTPSTYRKKAQLRMYRTVLNATDPTLYLAHSGSFYDNRGVNDDADLVAGEPLYTEGGVLSNSPAPPCRHASVFQRRLVVVTDKRVFWTKQLDAGYAPEFVTDDTSFQQLVPEAYGRVVATAAQSDRLTVFGERAGGIIFGNGPNNSGTQGQYQDIVQVMFNLGARWDAPKSVQVCPEGIWFQSKYGLRLFSGSDFARDERGVPVGAEIDDTAALAGYRCITLPAAGMQSTRFAFSMRDWSDANTGIHFFNFDQNWKQFTAFSNHDSVDAFVSADDYYVLGVRTADSVSLRSPTASYWREPSVAGTSQDYYSVIRTSWLPFGGIQGFQRLQRFDLLGLDALSLSQRFLISTRYDYAGTAFTSEVYDSGQTDSHKEIAATSTRFQIRHQFFTQKCESLQMEISWNPVEGDDSAGSCLRLTDLALLVGVKRGPWRKASQV